MADKVRYNKIIDLLERGKPVFSTSTVPNGNLDDLTYIADADYDAVVIEMEHEGFSFSTLRTSLQVLLNRKRIAEKGNLQPDVVPLVRIPPNARERDQWVIKQALDTGVYGLVLPHLSTVEDAQAASPRHAIPRCWARKTSNRRGSAVGAIASLRDTGA
jgi:4-hydroxy-2-oxoheptanedioate aldolase